MADAVEFLMDVGGRAEFDFAFAVLEVLGDGGGEVAREDDLFADAEFFTGADEGAPAGAFGIEGTEEEDFHFAGEAGAMTVEAGGDDTGVVEDEAIAGLDVGGEVAEVVVVEGLGRAIEDEHAGIGAAGKGVAGDEFVWEVVVKVFDS